MTNEAIEAAALLPCPFCGGKASADFADDAPGFEVGCFNPDCPAEPSIWKYTEAEAIAAWNTRAAAPALMEEGARLALEAAEYAFVAPGVWTQPWKVLRKLDPAAIVKGAGEQ